MRFRICRGAQRSIMPRLVLGVRLAAVGELRSIGAMPVKFPLEALRAALVHAGGLLLKVRQVPRPFHLYLSALLIFAASRLVVVIGVNFGTLLVRDADPTKWEAGPLWYHRLLRWDSGWYAGIVSNGYRYSTDSSVESSTVFYPVYPLLARALKSWFGIGEYTALLVVANVASLIAALLMTKFVRDELGEELALSTVAFFCFFPSSLFLSAGYTESVFLVFALSSLILLKHEKYVPAALAAGLSLGTRSTGIVLIPVILWEMLPRNTQAWPQHLPKIALCMLLAASGLLTYMAYLEIEFGAPLAVATGQAAWHHGTFFGRLLSGLMLRPFQQADLMDTVWFLSFLALTIWSFWHLRVSVSLYALGTLMLPYLTLGITGSMNRFVLMCFPAFMCLAILCKSRPWLTSIIGGIFGALLLRQTALFSQWYWAG
jgi:hypothetical protein